MPQAMNKVAVITGAGRGLGFALVKKFLADGYTVYGISRTLQSAKFAQKALSGFPKFISLNADLAIEPNVKKIISQILRQTRCLDILINNAGYGGKLEKVDELSFKEMRKSFDTNLNAAFLMCKHTIPIFRKQKSGFIVNISSMAGKRAVPRLFAYSAARFGVLALSQCVAKENADTNLKCITICPGGMNTRMRSDLFGKEDAEKQQSPDFVADVIYQVIRDKIQVESGGDIVIRHGKITAVNPCPTA